MTELSNKIVLKVEKSAREYCLECDKDSPLGELFDAITEMRTYVLNTMNKAIKDNENKFPPIDPNDNKFDPNEDQEMNGKIEAL